MYRSLYIPICINQQLVQPILILLSYNLLVNNALYKYCINGNKYKNKYKIKLNSDVEKITT